MGMNGWHRRIRFRVFHNKQAPFRNRWIMFCTYFITESLFCVKEKSCELPDSQDCFFHDGHRNQTGLHVQHDVFSAGIREENTAAGFLSDRRISLKKTLSDDMILHHNINKIIIT